jgi:hypothetical protein
MLGLFITKGLERVGHGEYLMIYRGPGFLAVVCLTPPFDSSPTHTHPFPVDRRHRKIKKERQLSDGREGKEVGEEPNHTTARKPGHL